MLIFYYEKVYTLSWEEEKRECVDSLRRNIYSDGEEFNVDEQTICSIRIGYKKNNSKKLYNSSDKMFVLIDSKGLFQSFEICRHHETFENTV